MLILDKYCLTSALLHRQTERSGKYPHRQGFIDATSMNPAGKE
jgi:hypothetical protein